MAMCKISFFFLAWHTLYHRGHSIPLLKPNYNRTWKKQLLYLCLNMTDPQIYVWRRIILNSSVCKVPIGRSLRTSWRPNHIPVMQGLALIWGKIHHSLPPHSNTQFTLSSDSNPWSPSVCPLLQHMVPDSQPPSSLPALISASLP